MESRNMRVNLLKFNNKFFVLITILFSPFLINSCILDVTVTPEEEVPIDTRLIITSLPADAEIFINGKNTGKKTPDTVKYISNKDLNIKLKLPFFRDTLFSVSLTPGSVNNVSIDYLANPTMYGNIFFTSSPLGAEILINDSALGKTTVHQIYKVVPGVYSVRYRLKNHRDAVFNVSVYSGNTSTASYKLRDTSVWVDFQPSNSEIHSTSLLCIAIDSKDTKWIGTSDKGLIAYDDIGFVNYNTINSPLPNKTILDITIDNNDRKWIGTSGGLAILDNGNWKVFTNSNSGLPSNQINSIIIDKYNVKWLGTPAGLVRFDEQSWILYDTIMPGYNLLHVRDIVIDNSNTFWLVSDVSGVVTFNEPFFTEVFEDSTSCLPTNRTSAADLFGDEVWITHTPEQGMQAGISVLTISTCRKLYWGSPSVSHNQVYVDKHNFKWICSNEGLFKIYNYTLTTNFTRTNSYLSSNNVTDIILDNNGQYWITTNGGGLNKQKTK
jgi:streptogramin lyase